MPGTRRGRGAGQKAPRGGPRCLLNGSGSRYDQAVRRRPRTRSRRGLRDEQGAELADLHGAKDPRFETRGRQGGDQESAGNFRPRAEIPAGGLRDAASDGGERQGNGGAGDPGLPDGLPAACLAADQPGEGNGRSGSEVKLQDEILARGRRVGGRRSGVVCQQPRLEGHDEDGIWCRTIEPEGLKAKTQQVSGKTPGAERRGEPGRGWRSGVASPWVAGAMRQNRVAQQRAKPSCRAGSFVRGSGGETFVSRSRKG